MNVRNIREKFPILSTKVYGKDLVYFDNAATSQRPASVIDKWNRLTSEFNANIHRGVHRLAEVATDEYETTRDAVRDFLNAESREEIVFTSGTTASINLVAFSFGEAFVKEGDEIIVSEAEHHSNIVPWQMLCMRKNALLKVLRIDDNGHFNLDELKSLITEHTRIVSVTQISNVLGIVNPVEEIVRICHERNVPVLIDGAQGVVHGGIDVRKVDCDFYAFSGHKMYAATGVGVLYGKKQWLDAMPPYMGGGEMIARVRFSGTTYADTPEKFEAGTQNFASVPTLKPAIEMMRMMQDEELQSELENVKDYLYGKLTENENITLYGVPREHYQRFRYFHFR